MKLNTSPENQSRLHRIQNEHRASPTPAEKHVMGLLTELSEPFIFEKGIFTSRTFFLVDFYLPKPRKLCLEIDGGYHKGQLYYDTMRDNFIRNERKMEVLRITNEVAQTLNAPDLLALINAVGRTKRKRSPNG